MGLVLNDRQLIPFKCGQLLKQKQANNQDKDITVMYIDAISCILRESGISLRLIYFSLLLRFFPWQQRGIISLQAGFGM